MIEIENESMNGFDCLNAGCTLCCLETIMPLTSKDIKRIVKLGYPPEDFITINEGEKRLKNINGKCVFLENKCTIYPNRPIGCRIYPHVLDTVTRSVIIDTNCPYHKHFKVNKETGKKLRKILKKLEQEKSKT